MTVDTIGLTGQRHHEDCYPGEGVCAHQKLPVHKRPGLLQAPGGGSGDPPSVPTDRLSPAGVAGSLVSRLAAPSIDVLPCRLQRHPHGRTRTM